MLRIPETIKNRDQFVEAIRTFTRSFGVEPNVVVLDPNSAVTLRTIGRVELGGLCEDQPDILVGQQFFGCTIEFGTRFDLRRVKA